MEVLRVFWAAIFFLFLTKCSGQVVHKVIGGEKAKESSIPYIVSIQKNEKHTCGGSILDELHILTAAHCVTSSTHEIHPSELTIQYGVTNLATQKYNRIHVANFKYHENYNAVDMFHDIAILILEKKISFNESVKAIELPQLNSVENIRAVLAGWGETQNEGVASNELQVVNITIYPDEKCEEIYEEFIVKTNRLYQMCAGVLEGGKGQCNGDSGGPLTIIGSRIQVGIVSWSRKPDNRCASKGSPGVFVKVANYINWINKTKRAPHEEL